MRSTSWNKYRFVSTVDVYILLTQHTVRCISVYMLSVYILICSLNLQIRTYFSTYQSILFTILGTVYKACPLKRRKKPPHPALDSR